ncbi:membrane protein of unknown function [uncultured Woeseiaceae bacterium]|uniref:Uncharacterized protein n=1 Tax=uncultured Woeseiaceae bacterium TaxID=1983305 RepID=A0A7D9D2M2_9GAMM|nr:membrane protein of unknown function [uncultured Woeseiaceae bacterium]
MSREKSASLIFGVLIFLVPFAYNFFVPTDPAIINANDYTFRAALSSPMLWGYAVPVVIICTFLIVRTTAMTVPTKIIYLVFTWLIFPIAALLLMHRLYWYKPFDIPTTLEEQRAILRANVERLKDGDG